VWKVFITFPNQIQLLEFHDLDVLKLVRNYVLGDPDLFMDKTRWIQGMGWDQTKWPAKKFPTAVSLHVNKFVYHAYSTVLG
jgi:hypothetical protein